MNIKSHFILLLLIFSFFNNQYSFADNIIMPAPPTIAASFSMEDPGNLYGQNIDSVFGFHGEHFRSKVIKKILPGLNPKLQNIAKKETKLKRWWSKS